MGLNCFAVIKYSGYRQSGLCRYHLTLSRCVFSKATAQKHTLAAATVTRSSRSPTSVLRCDTAPSSRQHDNSTHRNCRQVRCDAQRPSAADAAAVADASSF